MKPLNYRMTDYSIKEIVKYNETVNIFDVSYIISLISTETKECIIDLYLKYKEERIKLMKSLTKNAEVK